MTRYLDQRYNTRHNTCSRYRSISSAYGLAAMMMKSLSKGSRHVSLAPSHLHRMPARACNLRLCPPPPPAGIRFHQGRCGGTPTCGACTASRAFSTRTWGPSSRAQFHTWRSEGGREAAYATHSLRPYIWGHLHLNFSDAQVAKMPHCRVGYCVPPVQKGRWSTNGSAHTNVHQTRFIPSALTLLGDPPSDARRPPRAPTWRCCSRSHSAEAISR